MMMPTEEFYFGTKRTYFRRVAGDTCRFVESEWSTDDTPNAKENSLAFQNKVILEGCDIPIAVPGIPALDFVRQSFASTMESSDVPLVLHSPLLKCPEEEADIEDVVGVASGIRSALIKVNSKWCRLKGSGNNEDGFLMKESRSAVAMWQELRGSAFPSTTYRELMFTSYLSRILEPQGILCANSSVGYALYDHPLAPTIQPACIILETRGDRRLGTHVLAGLELILPLLLDTEAIDIDKLKDMFPEKRPGRDFTSVNDFVKTGEFMTDYVLGTFSAGCDDIMKGLCWPDVERDGTVLANLIHPKYALPIVSPCCSEGPSSLSLDGLHVSESGETSRPCKEYPLQWSNDGPSPMSDHWREAWDHTCNELTGLLLQIAAASACGAPEESVVLKENCASAGDCSNAQGTDKTCTPTSLVLAYLYSRCGYEAGRTLRGMHAEKVSWGTYQDELCNREWDEWHCNAHANNFVIVPEHSVPADHPGAQCLLSFLDLDMAFSAGDFIDIEADRVGVTDEFFASIQWKEYVSLMEVLAGSDSSTGVPKVAASVIAAQSNVITVVKSALYDTLIMGYLCGYKDDVERFPVMPYDATLHAAAHCIIRLAIIVMADYVA